MSDKAAEGEENSPTDSKDHLSEEKCQIVEKQKCQIVEKQQKSNQSEVPEVSRTNDFDVTKKINANLELDNEVESVKSETTTEVAETTSDNIISPPASTAVEQNLSDDCDATLKCNVKDIVSETAKSEEVAISSSVVNVISETTPPIVSDSLVKEVIASDKTISAAENSTEENKDECTKSSTAQSNAPHNKADDTEIPSESTESTTAQFNASDSDDQTKMPPPSVPTRSSTSHQSATTTESPVYENEHYRWCHSTQQWLPKPIETEHHKWDPIKQEWELKEQHSGEQKYEIDEDGMCTYKDKDGAIYFWDQTKSAWFPKIDDEFMARYQLNYGFIDNTSASEEEKRQKEAAEEKRKAEELKRLTEEAKAAAEENLEAGSSNLGKRKKEPPKWFEMNPDHNTKVYVSNLPLDITMDEFSEVMGKCGMINRDTKTQKFKLKLYTEPNGQLKGDGLCDYIKVESVDLALNILDEYELRGHKLHVQRAKFQMRGEYNPALKPKRRKDEKEKEQKMKQKLFDWRPDKMRGERGKHEKVVIIKNFFDPHVFEKEVQLLLEYQSDLREECSKFGKVKKVVIYDRNPEGVAQVNMSAPEEADMVVKLMNGRYFGSRKLSAELWDGRTKYKIAETTTDEQKRLAGWDSFLEADSEDAKEISASVSVTIDNREAD